MGALVGSYGYGSAQGAMQSSLAYSQAGTALQAGASVFGGIGQYQQARFQAQVAENNAQIERLNAGMALSQGAYEESASKLRTGQTIGAERAAQGANNVDLAVGSAPAVRQSTATLGAMDAAMIHFNAAKEAFNFQTLAANDEAQAKIDKRAGVNALLGGFLGAGSSLLSGGASTASKWAQWRLLTDPAQATT